MIHYHKLRNVEWKHVEERFKKYKLIGEKKYYLLMKD
jgi:hypothetical protein